jgi:hypothetical protein
VLNKAHADIFQMENGHLLGKIEYMQKDIDRLKAQLEVAKEYFSYITIDSYVADYQSEYFLCVKQAKEVLTRIAAMETKE